MKRLTRLLVRDSKFTFLGVKKSREGKVMLFRYMWFPNPHGDGYVFQLFQIYPVHRQRFEEEIYSSVDTLERGVQMTLGLKQFDSGLRP